MKLLPPCKLLYVRCYYLLGNLSIFFNKGKTPITPLQQRSVLRASPVASPKPFFKAIWGASYKRRFQPRPLNPFFVRRGPIRCPASRAHPLLTGDAPGTADTTKSEAKRRGTDASVARKPKTPSPTFGQAMLMAFQATPGRVSSCMAA
jgi:hypothetical protein